MSLPTANPSGDEKPPGDGSAEAREVEVDLSTLLDLQIERTAKDSRQANKIILGFCGFLICLALGWYAASDGNRRKVAALIEDVRASGKDAQLMKSPLSMADAYDRALEKIGTHSTDIDNASISMGVDPKKVHEDGMEDEMKAMMDGKGQTVGERNRLLQRTAGVMVDSDAKARRLKEASQAAHPTEEIKPEAKPGVPEAPVAKP
jgi:hypothetical protein